MAVPTTQLEGILPSEKNRGRSKVCFDGGVEVHLPSNNDYKKGPWLYSFEHSIIIVVFREVLFLKNRVVN